MNSNGSQKVKELFVLLVCIVTGWFGTVTGASLESGFVTIEIDALPFDIHYFRSLPAEPEAPSSTLLFFHGWPTSNAIWLPLFQELSVRANVDAYALSFPGFGRSSAPDINVFDYREEAMNQMPFAAADALGVERFIAVIHDAGGPWFLCPATETENLARLDGLVLLNTGHNVTMDPAQPVPVMQWFAQVLALPEVSRNTAAGLFAFFLEAGTVSSATSRFPGVVWEVAVQNNEDANRLAISAVIQSITGNPAGFGGVCGDAVIALETLDPVLIWALPNLASRLVMFQGLWPSAETVLIPKGGHFLMLDGEAQIAEAIAAYVARI